MKTPTALVTLLLAAATFAHAARAADPTLTSAQVTLIIKDVKTIDPGKAGRDAVLRETVQGDQNVRTGIESRTELLFNDHTITRLGANTHFSFSEGTRNMSLDSGVMLLQVPKGIGGAKIETSAVTAGITGTTIMLEQSKKFTKLIVLEGDCWLIGKLANGKFTRRIVAHAGQEIIFPVGGPNMPPPVFINLKLLEATSLLLNGRWGVRLDMRPILLAANGQGNNFVPLNGGGDAGGVPGGLVTDTTGKIPQTGNNNPPPPPPPPPSNPTRPIR